MRDPNAAKPTKGELIQAARDYLDQRLQSAAHRDEIAPLVENLMRWSGARSYEEAEEALRRAFFKFEIDPRKEKPTPPGRKRKTHQHREIARAVAALVEEFDLQETRTHTKQARDDWSACRIVQAPSPSSAGTCRNVRSKTSG